MGIERHAIVDREIVVVHVTSERRVAANLYISIRAVAKNVEAATGIAWWALNALVALVAFIALRPLDIPGSGNLTRTAISG